MAADAPILHLSLPVRDLGEATRFYVEVLGCRPGRRRDGWVDVWFHGMQLTLHEEPEFVQAPSQRGSRHFGVTLPRTELDALLERLDGLGVEWVRPPSTEAAGTPREQTKAMVADPSANAIELKAYVDPAAAFAD